VLIGTKVDMNKIKGENLTEADFSELENN